MPCGIASRGSSERSLPGGSRFLLALRCLCRFLAALGRLRPELLREPLDAPFGVEQLLPAGEKRMAVRADFEVQLGFGRLRLPGGAAGAARLDVEILRVNPFLHGELLGNFRKHLLYMPLTSYRGRTRRGAARSAVRRFSPDLRNRT